MYQIAIIDLKQMRLPSERATINSLILRSHGKINRKRSVRLSLVGSESVFKTSSYISQVKYIIPLKSYATLPV